jgi:hypothetical protein
MERVRVRKASVADQSAFMVLYTKYISDSISMEDRWSLGYT